jgi:phosphonate transport system ATP-binding protein
MKWFVRPDCDLRKKNNGEILIAPSPILRAEDLWFSYDNKSFVLQGVDLEVSHGVVTMILGRSGSGKTTLLKALRGLIQPQKGRVVHTPGSPSKTFSGERVAYIPQTLGLVRSMTALDNALAGALGSVGTLRSVLKWFPSRTVNQAKATLASLGLGDKWDRKIFSLSGGERQRVAIARALMQKPELILADEFVSQLDPITADEILHMTRKLASRGVGFVITTHELDIVEHYADAFLIVNNGKISHAGRVAEFNPESVKRFLKDEAARRH